MKKPCFQEEQKVRVLKDFTARDEMELSVRADEILVVLGQIRHLFTAFQRKMLGQFFQTQKFKVFFENSER